MVFILKPVKMKHTILFFSLIPFLFACKSTHFTPKDYKGDQIIAGTSGGVTGMMKEYVILGNGQLYMSNGLKGEWKEHNRLKRSEVKKLFSRAAGLGLANMKFRHPGNMTYYLIVKQPPRSNEIKWGESGITPPDGITEFYNYLISLF